MRASRFGSWVANVGAVALVVAVAAGCTSSAPVAATPAGVASVVVSASPSPSPTGIAARLLSLKDLPPGWSVDAAAADAPQTADCPLLNATLWNAPLPDRGEADLSRGLGGPYLVEVLADGNAGQADRAWQSLVNGIPKCTTFTHSSASGQSTFTISKSKLPGPGHGSGYGDGSYSFTLTIAISGGVNASGDIVAARSGNSVVVVYIVGLTGPSPDVVEGALSKAVAKART